MSAPAARKRFPFAGPDVKILGVREDDAIRLTVACAFIDRHVRSLDDYLDKKQALGRWLEDQSERLAERPVSVVLNAADDPGQKAVYLTVTGTSAEAGDDGEVGRGNRLNGLITPGRAMTIEAASIGDRTLRAVCDRQLQRLKTYWKSEPAADATARPAGRRPR